MNQMKPETKERVLQLPGSATLEDASTWMDDMRTPAMRLSSFASLTTVELMTLPDPST